MLKFSQKIFINQDNICIHFIKYYIINVALTNTNSAFKIVWVHNQNGDSILHGLTTNNDVFYVNSSGPYDIIAYFDSDASTISSGKVRNYYVVRENISAVNGVSNVSISELEATHLIKTIPTAPDGTTASITGRNECITHSSGLSLSTMKFDDPDQGDINETYYSNVSQNYKIERASQSEKQPIQTVHYYYGSTQGVAADTTFSNSPSDFRQMNVDWNLDQQSGNFQPILVGGSDTCGFATWNTNQTMSLPLIQTASSPNPNTMFIPDLGDDPDNTFGTLPIFF